MKYNCIHDIIPWCSNLSIQQDSTVFLAEIKQLPGDIYSISQEICTGFVVLCFVVVMQSFIMNSHEVFIHIHQGCFVGTGAIVRLPQCQWSKPDGYGKISQCITTAKHSKAKTVCIFLGIYCTSQVCIYACVFQRSVLLILAMPFLFQPSKPQYDIYREYMSYMVIYAAHFCPGSHNFNR